MLTPFRDLRVGQTFTFPRTIPVMVVERVFTERGVTALTYRPIEGVSPSDSSTICRAALSSVYSVEV
jgi:hypothetical protein